MKRIAKSLIGAAFILGLSACESATEPGGEARVDVAATGDAGTDPGAASSGTSSASQPFNSGSAEGTVDFRARVWVRTETNSWVELTKNAASQVSVDASGRQGARTLVTAHVDARGYDRVRIEFEEVRANVTGGFHIGSSLLTGEIRVDVGSGGRAIVERSIDLRPTASASAELVIDLNSSAWLERADAQARTVSRADFEGAVRVFVA